jgi:hypothetical protein
MDGFATAPFFTIQMAAWFVEGVADEVFHQKKAIIMAFVAGCNYL